MRIVIRFRLHILHEQNTVVVGKPEHKIMTKIKKEINISLTDKNIFQVQNITMLPLGKYIIKKKKNIDKQMFFNQFIIRIK